MNEYEARRVEKIRRNQALLAQLDIKPIIPQRQSTRANRPPAKKRKIGPDTTTTTTAPSRSSARIAAAAPTKKPTYSEDNIATTTKAAPRKGKKKSARRRDPRPTNDDDDEGPHVPAQTNDDDVRAIVAGWTSWRPTAPRPTRDGHTGVFHFASHPAFEPNKSPEEVLREGAFGGCYYRPLYPRSLGGGKVEVSDDWRELPEAWTEGIRADLLLAGTEYEAARNKFGVACGLSVEEWEAAGWIAIEHDARGWFQWYTRFFAGRRCADDERQVGRWRRCVGPTGRWRRALLKKYAVLGVREVFDDGVDEDAPPVSPVVHQTCHHWAFELRQEHLDEMWAERGG